MVAESHDAALVGQLAYLIDEIELLKPLISRVPLPLIEQRPFEGERSIKELFLEIEWRDKALREPNIRALLRGDEAAFNETAGAMPEESDSSTFGLPAVLDRVQEARRKLLQTVERAGEHEWRAVVAAASGDVSLFGYLHAVIQEDTDTLRRIAERIHESVPRGAPGFTRQ